MLSDKQSYGNTDGAPDPSTHRGSNAQAEHSAYASAQRRTNSSADAQAVEGTHKRAYQGTDTRTDCSRM